MLLHRQTIKDIKMGRYKMKAHFSKGRARNPDDCKNDPGRRKTPNNPIAKLTVAKEPTPTNEPVVLHFYNH